MSIKQKKKMCIKLAELNLTYAMSSLNNQHYYDFLNFPMR